MLAEVQAERQREIELVSQHIEISLAALIDRQNLRLGELIVRQQDGDADPLLAANLKQAEERLDVLDARRERRAPNSNRSATAPSPASTTTAPPGAAPSRTEEPHLAPMVRDEAIERIAMDADHRLPSGAGWQVEDVRRQQGLRRDLAEVRRWQRGHAHRRALRRGQGPGARGSGLPEPARV